METDEQLTARIQRERAVKKAWREFNRTPKTRRERKLIANLPAANISSKSIIVTRGRVQDGSGGGQPIFKNPHRKRKRIRGG